MRRSSFSGSRFGRRSSHRRPAGDLKGDLGGDLVGGVGGDPARDEKTVEAAAVRLLARREHSTDELQRKLVAKGHEEASVARVVEKLGSKRLVSDDRYVASFVHHHARRGQGPVRIRSDLRRQGIADSRIQQEFSSAGLDWAQIAAQVRLRKFGATPPRSLSERAKQSRFLQYRGFEADQIRAAFSVNTGTGADPEPGLDPDMAELDTDELDADAPDVD